MRATTLLLALPLGALALQAPKKRGIWTADTVVPSPVTVTSSSSSSTSVKNHCGTEPEAELSDEEDSLVTASLEKLSELQKQNLLLGRILPMMSDRDQHPLHYGRDWVSQLQEKSPNAPGASCSLWSDWSMHRIRPGAGIVNCQNDKCDGRESEPASSSTSKRRKFLTPSGPVSTLKPEDLVYAPGTPYHGYPRVRVWALLDAGTALKRGFLCSPWDAMLGGANMDTRSKSIRMIDSFMSSGGRMACRRNQDAEDYAVVDERKPWDLVEQHGEDFKRSKGDVWKFAGRPGYNTVLDSSDSDGECTYSPNQISTILSKLKKEYEQTDGGCFGYNEVFAGGLEQEDVLALMISFEADEESALPLDRESFSRYDEERLRFVEHILSGDSAGQFPPLERDAPLPILLGKPVRVDGEVRMRLNGKQNPENYVRQLMKKDLPVGGIMWYPPYNV